jgi:hypothetical protein
MAKASKVKVAEYRQAIWGCEEAIRRDYPACVGDSEKILWFVRAFNGFTALRGMNCPTAKDADHDRRERVFDTFSTHCNKNEILWMRARLYAALHKGLLEAYTQNNIPHPASEAHNDAMRHTLDWEEESLYTAVAGMPKCWRV